MMRSQTVLLLSAEKRKLFFAGPPTEKTCFSLGSRRVAAEHPIGGHYFSGKNLTLQVLSLMLGLILCMAPPAWAHRVNIFAFVDGNEIQVECGFNRSQKVKQGRVEVRNATTGLVVAEGITNDVGVFRFAVTPSMRQAGNDLQVRIVAGEGHQNDWTIEASEFAATSTLDNATLDNASATSSATSSATVPAPVSSSPSAPASGGDAASVQGASSADVERIVNAALDVKLSPIKHMLAAQAEAGPNLKDIIGGIGWIFGLVGVAAYFRRRP